MFPVITGLGLITSLGEGVRANWEALLAGRFITEHARLDAFAPPCRIGRIAGAAATQAVEQARWSETIVNAPDTAIVVGTSKGDVEGLLASRHEGTETQRHEGNFLPSCNGAFVPSAVHFPFSTLAQGPRLTFSAACASGLHALIHAVMLLQSGAVRRAVVIAAEASVHPLFLGSFRRLGILAPAGFGCRPFDLQRKGFVMSEAAAAVTLERPEDVDGGSAIAAVERFALAGDAAHLTGGDAQGRVLRRMIRQVLGERPVDLVHAHATGTQAHDAVEISALESAVCPLSPLPLVYSHKGALGHSLGASGLVSVVLNCLCHGQGVVPGNVQTHTPLPTRRLCLSHIPTPRSIGRSLTLAAGFGGALAAVTLRSVL